MSDKHFKFYYWFLERKVILLFVQRFVNEVVKHWSHFPELGG